VRFVTSGLAALRNDVERHRGGRGCGRVGPDELIDARRASCPALAGDLAAPPPRLPRRRRWWLAALGLTLLGLAATISWATADADGYHDLGALGAHVASDCLHLRWPFAAVVLALAGAHYVATAIAARASVGAPLRLRETVLVQLAAAAANRLTPAGLGGSAVNARFFSRRGIDHRAAIGAVVADLLVLSLLVFGGRLLDLGGGPHEVGLLGSKLAGLATPFRSPWLWSIAALGFVAGLVTWLIVRHRHRRRDRLSTTRWRRYFDPIKGLSHQPRRLAVLLAASGCTTLVLAFAFTASVAMVPGPQPQISTGGLLVAFMAGAAAGNAVPTPAGIGSAEVAFVGVLVAAHVPAGHALEVVIIFRLITFWLPAVVGVLATRHLRRTAAI
jgi:uncharacterized membrane protein YbhN (UPF0104 family)